MDAWRNLGAMLRQQGKAEEGLQCQLNALRLKPDDAGILSNIGNAFRDLHRYEESQKAFEKASLLAPNLVGPILGLCITLNAMKEYNQAIEKSRDFIENIILEKNAEDYSQLLLKWVIHTTR